MYKLLKRVSAAALCALMLAGCQFVEYDKEKDMAQVVAQIGTVQITKQQVYDELEPLMASYYSSLDPESEEYKDIEKKMKSEILKYLAEMEMVMQKSAAEGTDKLTAAEQKEIDENYQDYINYYTELARSNLEERKEEDSSVDVEASLEAEVDKLLEEQGYTREKIKELLRKSKVYEKYKDKIVKDVTASAEQTQKYYQETVDEQKKKYDEDPTAVDTDFNNGELILYYPTKHVLVTQVLIEISDEDEAAIDKVSDNTGLTDEEKEEQTAALREKALAKIKPTADKVYNLAKSGKDFAELIEQYNDDPGMENETIMGLGGYLVSEDANYMEAFKTAALALTRAGDISKPTVTDYGYHIICAQAAYEAGSEVGLDAVRDDFKPKADDLAKTDAWDAHVEDLKKELKVFIYENRL